LNELAASVDKVFQTLLKVRFRKKSMRVDRNQ